MQLYFSKRLNEPGLYIHVSKTSTKSLSQPILGQLTTVHTINIYIKIVIKKKSFSPRLTVKQILNPDNFYKTNFTPNEIYQ